MKTSLHVAKPGHEIAYQDICALLNKHAGQLSAVEMLAIAANMLGKLLAYQDQRTMISEAAMEVVIQNIQLGNAQAVDAIKDSKGRAAVRHD